MELSSIHAELAALESPVEEGIYEEREKEKRQAEKLKANYP